MPCIPLWIFERLENDLSDHSFWQIENVCVTIAKRNNWLQIVLQNVTEATVNMAYVTHRTLKTSMSNVIPKSGRVKVSLQVEDERWKRRIGKWDPDSRTFTEVRLLVQVWFTFLGTFIHEITSYIYTVIPRTR